MTWRGPAAGVLSAALVAVAMLASWFPVAGLTLFPAIGVALTTCVWFAYWGALGSVIAFAVPALIRAPFVPAMGGIFTVALFIGVFVGLVRRWWISAEDRRLANLVRLAQALLIALLVRQAAILVIIIMPAIYRYPQMAGQFLWRTTEALFEIGLTTFVVVFLLLRLASPWARKLRWV